MSSAQPSPLAPEEIARDAHWLAQAMDPAADVVRLIAMDRDAYRQASFLDDRMLQRPLTTQLVPVQTVMSAVALEARRDARWIFHIGHVGSTLVARLLGELPNVLSVREPRLLRDITTVAAAHRSAFTDAAQALFSRTFAPEETALVKATSFVSEIAAELVPAGGGALFMYAAPRAYIASILAGENSLHEQRILAVSRGQRMAGRVQGLDSQQRSDAHLAAAAWACEMTSLEAAAAAMPDRQVAWLDFDRALDAMGSELARLAGFFGFAANDRHIDAVVRGPLMSRYSKALEYEYSPGLRRELLAQAARAHGREIDDALAMLGRAAEKSPLLASALERAQAEI